MLDLLTTLIAFLKETATDEAVQRTVWDVLLSIGELAAAVAAIGALAWWLIGPRVRAFATEVVVKVNETHRNVTVNGGVSDPPTFRDDVSQVRDDVKGLTRAVATNTRRVEDVAEDVAETKRTLDEHLTTGELYLDQVQVVLKRHGIDLPQIDEASHDDRGPDERPDLD